MRDEKKKSFSRDLLFFYDDRFTAKIYGDKDDISHYSIGKSVKLYKTVSIFVN